MKKTLFSVAVIAAIFSGCATSGYMQNGSKVKDAEPITMGIDHTDFEKAASDAVESLLSRQTRRRTLRRSYGQGYKRYDPAHRYGFTNQKNPHRYAKKR